MNKNWQGRFFFHAQLLSYKVDTIAVSGGPHTDSTFLVSTHAEFGTDLGFVEILAEPTNTRREGGGGAAARTHPPPKQHRKAGYTENR